MREEEKEEEEKKQKRNGQLPSAKRGLFLLPHHGKNVAHEDDGAFKYLLEGGSLGIWCIWKTSQQSSAAMFQESINPCNLLLNPT